MQRKIDWQKIAAGRAADGFDFGAKRTDKEITELATKLASTRAWPEQRQALVEIVRVYCEYRKEATGKSFGISMTSPGHRKMLESAKAAAAHMLTIGTSPIHVLKYISRPGGTSWANNNADMSFVPWNMYTSVRMIDSAAAWSAPGSQVVKQTHAFDQTAVATHDGDALRRKLEAKFGKAAIDAITTSDGDLIQKVAMRAEALRKTPSLFLPPAYREIIRWLADNP